MLNESVSQGKIKWYSPEKMYGFIIPDAKGEDVFVHGRVLKNCGIDFVKEGERVEYTLGEHKGRVQAENVKVV